MKDDQTVSALRSAAMGGARVADLLRLAQSRLGSDASVPIIAHLRWAFEIPIPTGMELSAWKGFPGGTLSDDEVEVVARPRIQSWQNGRSS